MLVGPQKPKSQKVPTVRTSEETTSIAEPIEPNVKSFLKHVTDWSTACSAALALPNEITIRMIDSMKPHERTAFENSIVVIRKMIEHLETIIAELERRNTEEGQLSLIFGALGNKA